jgi:hypothetical protein
MAACQAFSLERERTEMDDAIRLLKTQQMKGLPSELEASPSGIGVVYASAEITAESARRDRLSDSLLAEEAGFNLAQYTAWAAADPAAREAAWPTLSR